MEAREVERICTDIGTFTAAIFGGCGGRPMMANIGLCVHTRLGDARRKTHQPAGQHLAQNASEADALRQKMNRATLAPWDDAVVRRRLYELARHVVPGAFAWIIDDTSIEKKGTKSPGVARQYSGTVGKVSNCQAVVSTHLAGWTGSLPLEMELFVPEVWFNDAERCREAGIPDDLEFRTKVVMALEQVDRLLAAGVPPPGVLLSDLGYGKSGMFRRGLRERKLEYVVGIPENLAVWRPDEGPLPPPRYSGLGRPPTKWRIGEHLPVSVRELAFELPEDAWSDVELELGRHERVRTRFAALRVRTAHRARAGAPPGEEEWLLVEWPEGAASPTHYFLSNLAPETTVQRLAEVAKLRWRVERDYQDLKQEVGFAHHEGRRWRGFNHHLTICMAAMAYLAARRALSPPRPYGVASVGPPSDSGGA
jgi:SRSO17 transposase